MRQVDASMTLDVDREEVCETLSPESIIEYEGTYEVEDVEEADDGWLISASTVVDEQDIEIELAFQKLPNGYAYELVDEGPFEELYTAITVHDGTESEEEVALDEDQIGDVPDDRVRIIMRSEYTFGGLLSPVLDWFAVDTRRQELERALLALADDLDAIDVPDDQEPDENEGTTERESGHAK